MFPGEAGGKGFETNNAKIISTNGLRGGLKEVKASGDI
jgi:hypothetical protein